MHGSNLSPLCRACRSFEKLLNLYSKGQKYNFLKTLRLLPLSPRNAWPQIFAANAVPNGFHHNHRFITHSLIHSSTHSMKNWPLWEIFIRSKQGLSHKHVGSLHAADAQMALENARDVYCRRNEGISIWVVESAHIHASTEDPEAFFDPSNDKVYRHPTFYELPDAVKHM